MPYGIAMQFGKAARLAMCLQFRQEIGNGNNWINSQNFRIWGKDVSNEVNVINAQLM